MKANEIESLIESGRLKYHHTARCASYGLWCKAIAPKMAKQMINEGAEFIKITDIY